MEKQTLVRALKQRLFASAETASKIEAAKAEAELEAIAVGDTATFLQAAVARILLLGMTGRYSEERCARCCRPRDCQGGSVGSEANVWAATKEIPTSRGLWHPSKRRERGRQRG